MIYISVPKRALMLLMKSRIRWSSRRIPIFSISCEDVRKIKEAVTRAEDELQFRYACSKNLLQKYYVEKNIMSMIWINLIFLT